MKKVLIAIDYHPVSEKVAEAGYDLAKKLGAKVCLLHITAEQQYYNLEYPSFLGYEGYDFSVDLRVQSEIERVAEDFLEKAAAHLKNDVETHLTRGDTANSILDYAEEWEADLIVMGTRSHSTLEKLFMGSEATKVLEKTTIPVYMVPVKK